MDYIRKVFKFECAHRLYGLEYSPCKCTHGHSYKVWATIFTKELNDYGMVVDFSKLKTFQKWLDENFDHALILNKSDPLLDCLPKGEKIYIMDTTTTAEHMARLFSQQLKKTLSILPEYSNFTKFVIEVAETEGNSAFHEMIL